MARGPSSAFRKALGFAPAMTAGLALAVAVELVAGTAWKPARPSKPAGAASVAEPGRRAEPRGERTHPGILAPVSVYDWSRTKDI